jgi:hypothetical protein
MVMILGVFVGREAEGQKIAACGSSYGGRALLQAKKKALLSKTFLNFGARGRL